MYIVQPAAVYMYASCIRNSMCSVFEVDIRILKVYIAAFAIEKHSAAILLFAIMFHN